MTPTLAGPPVTFNTDVSALPVVPAVGMMMPGETLYVCAMAVPARHARTAAMDKVFVD
jgi:hypothetical protein